MKNDGLDYENRPRKNGVTSADLKLIHQRRIEEAAERESASEANLHRAVRLAQRCACSRARADHSGGSACTAGTGAPP